MKIIHTGDIHLGSPMQSLPADKAAIRRAEILDGFRRLCLYARDNGVSAVLIAGDLFDEAKVSKNLCSEVLSVIHQAGPVCFFYVSGNHDEAFDFAQSLPDNLYLFSQNRTWRSYDLPENITVTGMDSAYLQSGAYASLSLRNERYNILLMHGEIARGENVRGAEGISLNRLQNKGIDYLALGHIHIPMQQAESLDGRGRYRYCGCLEGRGFDECGKRGCFLLDVRENRLVSQHFLSFGKREVCERVADISACANYYDIERAAANALRDVRGEDLVKLVLRGRFKAGLAKDTGLLASRLAQSFFHVKVVDESRLFVDYNDFKNDLSERGEFVREVGRYEMSEEDRAEILDVGLKALAGEDIDL